MTRKLYQRTPAVFCILIDNGERVLLHRRFHTGYMDGFYDFPSGHLEPGEALQNGAAHELGEETGVITDPDELVLMHINQNNSDAEKPYINFIFLVRRWTGRPTICEPEKSDHMDFFHLSALSETTLQVQ